MIYYGHFPIIDREGVYNNTMVLICYLFIFIVITVIVLVYVSFYTVRNGYVGVGYYLLCARLDSISRVTSHRSVIQTARVSTSLLSFVQNLTVAKMQIRVQYTGI